MRILGAALAACCLWAMLAGCHGEPAAPKPLAMVDLMTFGAPARLALSGIEGLERDEAGMWRWGLGPQTSFRFFALAAKPYVLRFRLMNPIPDQTISITLNGRELASYGPLPAVKWLTPSVADAVRFTAKAGENVLTFGYADWNGRQTVYMPTDQRPLATVFLAFVLYAE